MTGSGKNQDERELLSDNVATRKTLYNFHFAATSEKLPWPTP
jgi:hypothetical protein